MGDFKVPYPAALRQVYKPFEPVKSKMIGPIRADGDVNELYSRTLPADLCVQRRGEHRGENHIDAEICRVFQVLLGDVPVLFAEDRDLVVGCKAVHVEPFGVDQLLLRKDCWNNV